MGLRPGRVMAALAGLSEVTGGVLLAVGFVTPLAAAMLIATMTLAIAAAARVTAADTGPARPAGA
jgi:putative oxidoreductase